MPQFLFFCHPQKVRKRRGECHWTHLLCANKRCDEMVREIFIHAEVRSRERGHSTTMWTKFYTILTTYPLSTFDILWTSLFFLFLSIHIFVHIFFHVFFHILSIFLSGFLSRYLSRYLSRCLTRCCLTRCLFRFLSRFLSTWIFREPPWYMPPTPGGQTLT